VGDELLREPRALVADVQLDLPVPSLRLQANTPETMAEGVLDEVPDRLLGAQAIDGQLQFALHLNLERPVGRSGAALVALPHARNQLARGQPLPPDR